MKKLTKDQKHFIWMLSNLSVGLIWEWIVYSKMHKHIGKPLYNALKAAKGNKVAIIGLLVICLVEGSLSDMSAGIIIRSLEQFRVKVYNNKKSDVDADIIIDENGNMNFKEQTA